jgi:putative transposase
MTLTRILDEAYSRAAVFVNPMMPCFVATRDYGNGFKVDGRRLKVAGIGRVAVRWHREVPETIKTLRLTRKAGKWYAVLACEVAAEPLPATGVDVGIDVGITSLIITSAGEHVEHPAWYRRAQKRLRVGQRRVARRQKGGANRRKAVVALQREYERICQPTPRFSLQAEPSAAHDLRLCGS